jgi:hypothetical protein
MRDIFDEAIGASPPATVDIDTVVILRRRIARLRSAGALGGAGAAVAAIVAIAVVAGLFGGGTAAQFPGSGDHSGGVGGASPSAAPLPSRPPETAQQITQRLTTTLTARLTALLPGVHLADRRTKKPRVRVYPRNAEPAGGYLSTLRVTTSAGSGTFGLVSSPRPKPGPSPSPTGPMTDRPDPPATCAEFWAGSQTAPAHPNDRHCTASTGPDGQIVLSALDRLGANAVRYEVVVLWAGAYVDLTLENYFEGWQNEGDPPTMTFLPSPQLTLNQLATLAQDPDLAP